MVKGGVSTAGLRWPRLPRHEREREGKNHHGQKRDAKSDGQAERAGQAVGATHRAVITLRTRHLSFVRLRHGRSHRNGESREGAEPPPVR
jgi:hypothetical protein